MDIHLTPSIEQHFYLSQKMVASLYTLQLPVLEFAEWLKEEVEKNPFLEHEYTQHKIYPETAIIHHPSLFEYLMEQARLICGPKELPIAEILIGNLDDDGFLSLPLEAFSSQYAIEMLETILTKIQSLEPCGVGARNLQESLLIQLTAKGKAHGVSYQLILLHFDNLLHHRFSLIQRDTGLTHKKLVELIAKEISPLDIHPGRRFVESHTQLVIPDIAFRKEGESWAIEINEEPLPQFKVTAESKILYDQLKPEEKPFVEKHLLSAHWLKQLIAQRQETLYKIAEYILKVQTPFFEGHTSAFIPMTLHDVALALGHHASTISRAILHKHLAFPGGLIPLQDLLCHKQSPSKELAKKMIAEWIQQENKKEPLSDEALSKKLKNNGIACARRTVAKYRRSLNIPTVPFRTQNP